VDDSFAINTNKKSKKRLKHIQNDEPFTFKRQWSLAENRKTGEITGDLVAVLERLVSKKYVMHISDLTLFLVPGR
jgi:hypothetical protein